jgi:serine phosphatase RsbU (regulator of sigma subunit)
MLEQANNLLCPDIPPNMFATCLYMILDPASGCLQYANAGHNLPALQTGQGVVELRATGMPLGLMPGMTYEQKEAQLTPGSRLLMYSDGLVEAHNPQGEMFGIPRLLELMSKELVAPNGSSGGAGLIALLEASLGDFTGPGWEQEDDVTLVTLDYLQSGWHVEDLVQSGFGAEETFQRRSGFELPGGSGGDRQARS